MATVSVTLVYFCTNITFKILPFVNFWGLQQVHEIIVKESAQVEFMNVIDQTQKKNKKQIHMYFLINQKSKYNLNVLYLLAAVLKCEQFCCFI
jgi:peroxiredoxin family protein